MLYCLVTFRFDYLLLKHKNKNNDVEGFHVLDDVEGLHVVESGKLNGCMTLDDVEGVRVVEIGK